MASLRVYIVFAVISLTFLGLSKLSKFQTSRPRGSLAATLQRQCLYHLYQIVALKLILRLRRGNTPEYMRKPHVYL